MIEDINSMLDDHERFLKGKRNSSQLYLRGELLTKRDFSKRDLTSASLIRCDLGGSNFKNSNLTDCVLVDSNLRGCDLRVKSPPVNDHRFISEILFREAKTLEERSWAGIIHISADWCWHDFLTLCSPLMVKWVKNSLCSKWVEFNRMFSLTFKSVCGEKK